MPDSQWWFADGATSRGPIGEGELLTMLRAGTLPLSTPLWQPGMTEWRPAAEVGVLSAQLPPARRLGGGETPPLTPPPLPIAPAAVPRATDGPISQAWPRWFARLWLDYALAGLLVGIVLAVVAPTSPILSSDYALLWIAIVVWIPIEAVLLATVGATPGKYLIGMRVLNSHGGLLTFTQALLRSLGVWVIGCAFMLPIVLPFTFLAQYNRLKAGRAASYDERGHFIVVQTPLSLGRKVLLVVVTLGVLAIVVLGTLASASE